MSHRICAKGRLVVDHRVMPLTVSAIEAAALAGYLRAARGQLVGSAAATAVAGAAEPSEIRAALAGLLRELETPPGPGGLVELTVVDDIAFAPAAHHLRGILGWLDALTAAGVLRLPRPPSVDEVVEHIFVHTARLQAAREAQPRQQD